MATKFKNINQMDYDLLLSRVNKSICQYNGSSDQTAEAKSFIMKIDEMSTSRKEFFDNVEKRLSNLITPDKLLVDWFISKRSTLEFVVAKIRAREAENPEQMRNKYSAEMLAGFRTIESLLTVDVNDLGQQHCNDIMIVKKTIAEIRGDMASKPSTGPTTSSSTNTADTQQINRQTSSNHVFVQDFFYVILCDICTKLRVVLYESAQCTVPIKLEVELTAWHGNLVTWSSKYKQSQSTPFQLQLGFSRLVKTVISLLAELIKLGKQSRINDTLNGDAATSTASVAEDIATVNKHFPVYKLEMLLSVAADIKSQEWSRLKVLCATGASSSSGSTAASGSSSGQNTELDKLITKKRKAVTDIVTKVSSSNVSVMDRQQLQTRLIQATESEDVDALDWLQSIAKNKSFNAHIMSDTSKIVNYKGVILVPKSLSVSS